MTQLRALAIDIDGTLIDSRKQILPFTRSEIHRVVREYNVHPILITARGPESTGVIEQRLGLTASYATFGGSLVWSRNGSGTFETVSEVPLLTEDVESILAIAARHDVHAGLYSRNVWYVSSLDYWALREARNTAVWPQVAELTEVAGPFFKIMFRGEQEPLARLAAELRDSPTSTFAHHLRHVLEIVPGAAVKLPALSALVEHRGLTLDQVIAFGDSASDLQMLEKVGVGVLMGNASAAVVASSRVERTLSNDEDGIGVMLRKHFPSDEPFLP